jgi:hypothetical protein
MKKFNYVLLLSFMLLLIAGCAKEDLAPELDQSDLVTTTLKGAKSSPNLIGTTYTPFTLTPPTFWNGTVDFGDVGTYGITFFSFPPSPRTFSQASPFKEEFIIYELGNPDNVYLRGWDNGVVTKANKDPEDTSIFHANGKITEASGPLEMWQGRSVHIKGEVTWVAVGLPEFATSIFRIN